jgi:hypothetical protein
MAPKKNKAPALAPASPIVPRLSRGAWSFSWRVIWPLAPVALIVAFQPVQSADLWWDLSRGREVITGSLHPSADLLALDTAAEADWLGGVPWFVAHSTLGDHGLMLLRVVATALACLALAIWGCKSNTLFSLILGVAVLLCLRDAVDPGGLLFDTFGAALVFAVGVRYGRQPTRSRLVPLAIVILLWANFGPRVILAYPVLVSSLLLSCDGDKRRCLRPVLLALMTAIIAGCITPRGLGTLGDSARMVFPVVAAQGANLEFTPWTPLARGPWGSVEAGFLLLTFVVALLLTRTAGRLFFSLAMVLLIAHLATWTSAPNLAPSATWLAMAAITVAAQTAELRPAPRFGYLFDSPLPRRTDFYVAISAAVVCGGALGIFRAGGWGIHADLDFRYLELALGDVPAHGTILADSGRSAGMAAWLRPGELQVQDTPQRALLGGRLAAHQHLLDDLRHERKMSYHRANGDTGGWWIPLAERRTALLLIAAEDLAMIRALEPSLWKPFSLDSPVLPYASTADTYYTARILETLSHANFVNVGPWSYSPPASTQSAFDRDLWGWREHAADRPSSLRQSRVFRAMGLTTAALRVLRYEQGRGDSPELHREVAECQANLYHSEVVVAGQASRFRELAVAAMAPATEAPPRAAASSPPAARPDSLAWRRAIDAYVNGDLPVALASLSQGALGVGVDPEAMYAQAWILLEQGDPEAAHQQLKAIEADADKALRLLVQDLQASLTWDSSQPDAGNTLPALP